MFCALMFITSNHYGMKCLSNLIQLKPCNAIFKVTSDIMPHSYDLRSTIVMAINFWNAKKMNCALMFILSNHYGMICLSNLIQFEPYNVTFKMISDIMPQSYDL